MSWRFARSWYSGGGYGFTMVWQGSLFVLGILMDIIGLAGVAYPAYQAITKREREKVAPEILALSKEMLTTLCLAAVIYERKPPY